MVRRSGIDILKARMLADLIIMLLDRHMSTDIRKANLVIEEIDKIRPTDLRVNGKRTGKMATHRSIGAKIYVVEDFATLKGVVKQQDIVANSLNENAWESYITKKLSRPMSFYGDARSIIGQRRDIRYLPYIEVDTTDPRLLEREENDNHRYTFTKIDALLGYMWQYCRNKGIMKEKYPELLDIIEETYNIYLERH